MPVGAWRLPPSHWVVGAPKPPPVAPGSARNTRSHDSPLHPVPPRCSGPGARLAPGGPAERAGAKTRRELQCGPRGRLVGERGGGEVRLSIIFKKKKENHNSVLLAEEGKDATAAFHGDCDDQDDIVERSWKPLTGSIQCHDIHTHGEGERSHGNSLQQSNASFCKSVKHATKKSNKQTRQKSSWNKNQ